MHKLKSFLASLLSQNADETIFELLWGWRETKQKWQNRLLIFLFYQTKLNWKKWQKKHNKIESAESFVDFALLPNNKGGKAFKVTCARHNNPRNERKVDIWRAVCKYIYWQLQIFTVIISSWFSRERIWSHFLLKQFRLIFGLQQRNLKVLLLELKQRGLA